MPRRIIILKRKWRKENFDERKVYASIYSACMSAYFNELKCEKIATKLTKILKVWLKNKKIVSSNSIRKNIMTELGKIDNTLKFHYDKYLPNLLEL